MNWIYTNSSPLKEKFGFGTLSLIIRIYKIIYDGLQHCYDERCSPESWSSLLMSLVAENNRGAWALRQEIQFTLVWKDVELAECLVASSHVLTLKHEAKHGYITQKQLFVCFMKQLKETLLGYILYLCYLCVSVSVHERTPLNIQRVSLLLKRAFIVFFDGLSECTCSSVVSS